MSFPGEGAIEIVNERGKRKAWAFDQASFDFTAFFSRVVCSNACAHFVSPFRGRFLTVSPKACWKFRTYEA